MKSVRENLEDWYDDEMAALEKDLKEGHISLEEYNTYFKNIQREYEDSLKEFYDE